MHLNKLCMREKIKALEKLRQLLKQKKKKRNNEIRNKNKLMID